MAFHRIDHVIFSVPDIEAAHTTLTALYPEAWPVGRFWPDGRTSGIAVGGFNVELIQLDENPPDKPVGTTLVFEPRSSGDAYAVCEQMFNIPLLSFEKFESDPELLRLRGFGPNASQMPQLICRNLAPMDPSSAPFDFFFCDYAPFLKEWLSPDHPRLRTNTQVVSLTYGTPDAEEANHMFRNMSYRGDIYIHFEPRFDRSILSINTQDGPLPLPGLLEPA